MRRALLLLAALVALPLLGAPLYAQSFVNTSLTVNLPATTGGGVRNLAFGNVAPGGNADTGPGQETNANTAKWSFGALPKTMALSLNFTLPATLTKGSSTLNIVWPAAYGSWCSYRAAETCAASTTFNPQAGSFTVTATTAGGAGNNDRVLDVWLGAQLTVPADAQAGLYSGVLTLTIPELGV
jgi:hypothetical protein